MDERPPTDMQQDAQGGGRPQLRVRVDERSLSTSYANAFRSHATTDEVILDFGLNMVSQSPNAQGGGQQGGQQAGQPQGEMLFRVNDRIILNYYTAKRLALTLGQLIQRHESQFGELKLNAAERRAGGAG